MENKITHYIMIACQMGCSNKMIDGHPEVVCQSSFSGYRVEVNNTVIGDPAPIGTF